MIRERSHSTLSGWLVLPIFLVAGYLLGRQFYHILQFPTGVDLPWTVAWSILLLADLLCLGGFVVVNPNEARVLQLFGSYVGTARTPGLRWTNPLYSKRSISTRVRNFESERIKVNDHDGNPIEIASVVVWRVVDTAEATFEVDDYRNYIKVQSDSALRNLAAQHPYEAHNEGQMSLRGNTPQIATLLKQEIQDRLSRAGVEVLEARISHLAYAPEIAQVMLRRQQANAIVAARQRIVEGAVGMVEQALTMLAKNNIVTLDDRKAAMVSNLMVVLCGERDAQPIVNTGTLYQ